MAEAVLKVDWISQGSNASCSCSFCVKFKERESEFEEKTHLMEEIAQEVLRKHLPEKVPINAKRLTVKLLDGYFQQESACHGLDGLQFTTCLVIDAIKKKVYSIFPMASADFEKNVQTWFQGRKSSASTVKSTGAKLEDKLCSFCMIQHNEVLKQQRVTDFDDEEMAKNLKKYFPEKPNSYKEMVEFFLNDYTLNHCPLNMKSNCFGAKFKDCLVLDCISERGLDIFDATTEITDEKTNQIAQDWFHEQHKHFENLKSVTIVDMESECTHTPNVMEIMLQEEWIGDATVMIHGILDAIFKKYFVGFVLACRSSMNIPISLHQVIFGIVSKKHPQLQEVSYQDCITKWFESRV